MKSTYDVVAIVVVRRFEADNKCWPSLKKMALQTDLSNLRLHPALITPLRSNNPRAQIWEKIRRRAGKCPPRRRNDGAHQGTVEKEEQVAFAITGTRWGGPRFLRLTTPRRVAGRRAADLRHAEGHLQTIIGMIEGSGPASNLLSSYRRSWRAAHTYMSVA